MREVLSGAWAKTWQPLGWDRRKAGVALLAVGTILVAFFQFGWLEMITTATGVLWAAVPAAFAAIVLFVWGIIETQAKMYFDLKEASKSQVAALEARLAKYEGDRPNYAAIRLQHQYPLGAASRLWCDIDARAPTTIDSEAWFTTFVSAIQQRKLNFVPQDREPAMVEYERQNPTFRTVITRDELKRYAASIGEDPIFLRDN